MNKTLFWLAIAAGGAVALVTAARNRRRQMVEEGAFPILQVSDVTRKALGVSSLWSPEMRRLGYAFVPGESGFYPAFVAPIPGSLIFHEGGYVPADDAVRPRGG